MAEQSYKILAAQRLAIDPNELLGFFEFRDHILVTTPDGRQHKFTFAELNRPQSPLQKSENLGVDRPGPAGARRPKDTKKVAKKS
jgi:hypothetical protein